VRLAYQFAVESELVRADGIEATEFPDLTEKFRVFAVPKTIVNGESYVEGSLSEGAFLDAILKTLKPPEQSAESKAESRRTNKSKSPISEGR
jgi:hypothetical protein